MPQSVDESPPPEVPLNILQKSFHFLLSRLEPSPALWFTLCSLTASLVRYLFLLLTDSPEHGLSSSATPWALSMRFKSIYQKHEDSKRELLSQKGKMKYWLLDSNASSSLPTKLHHKGAGVAVFFCLWLPKMLHGSTRVSVFYSQLLSLV